MVLALSLVNVTAAERIKANLRRILSDTLPPVKVVIYHHDK